MTIEYRTLDSLGNIYRVSDFHDIHGKPTSDPRLAASCVIHDLARDVIWACEAADIPVYPVH